MSRADRQKAEQGPISSVLKPVSATVAYMRPAAIDLKCMGARVSTVLRIPTEVEPCGCFDHMLWSSSGQRQNYINFYLCPGEDVPKVRLCPFMSWYSEN